MRESLDSDDGDELRAEHSTSTLAGTHAHAITAMTTDNVKCEIMVRAKSFEGKFQAHMIEFQRKTSPSTRLG